MLDDLHRIHLGNVLDGIPNRDCWGDCPMMDIPNTVIASIRHASSRIKALTFAPMAPEVNDRIRRACWHRGIIVVWARPPGFERYLDE